MEVRNRLGPFYGTNPFVCNTLGLEAAFMLISDSLESLEQQRAYIANRITVLGDLRCGSITSTAGRCGKPTCHCHQPNDLSHGPNLRLTYKADGKTVTQSLPDQAATRKVGKRDRRVSQTASTAQEICRGQCADLPDAPTGTRHAVGAGKKTAGAVQQEVAREIDRILRVIFNGRSKSGRLDWEAIEMAVRSAMHRAGATALTELLQFPAPAADQRRLPCPCGHQAHYLELRSKPLLTAVGPGELLRPYYLCPHCHCGQFPAPTWNSTSKTPSALRESAARRRG